MTTSSAIPSRLLRYSAAAQDADDRLREAATPLGAALDAFRAGGPEFMGVIPPLDDRLRAHARAARHTDEWVGDVGRAFLQAGGGVLAPFLSALYLALDQKLTVDDAAIAARVGQATEADALEAARVDAAALRAVLDRAGDAAEPLPGEWEGFEEEYPQLLAVMARLRANSQDETYAQALVNELGEDGVRRVLNLADAAAMAAYGDAERDLYAEVVEPFAAVFAAATRSRRALGVTDRILDTQSPYEQRQLALLLAAGDHDPDFAARGAQRILVDRPELNRFLGYMPLTDGRPELASFELVAIEGLDRDQEAAFLFATRGENYEALLRPPSALVLDEDAYHAMAGRVLEQALVAFPEGSGDPRAVQSATETFEKVIVSAGEGDVPDPVKRSLAAITVTTDKIDRLARALDETPGLGEPTGLAPALDVDHDEVKAFFAELAHDDHAVATLSAGITFYMHQQLATGIRQGARESPFDTGAVSGEADKVGVLWGTLGEGLHEARGDDEERTKIVVTAFQTTARVAGALGIAAAPLTAGQSAVAGLSVEGASRLGTEVLERALESDVEKTRDFVERVTAPMSEDIARLLYDDPGARVAIGGEGARHESYEEWRRHPAVDDRVTEIKNAVAAPLIDKVLMAAALDG